MPLHRSFLPPRWHEPTDTGCQAFVDQKSLVPDKEKQFEVDRHKRLQGAN